FPTLAQPLEGLREQCRAVLVGPAFLDVGEMRLVGLGALRLRRVVLVPARGQSAARAFPLVRDFRVDGEERPRFVLVGTPIRHRNPRNRFATLGFPARTAPDSRPPNSVTATHHRCSHPYSRADSLPSG